MFVCVCVLVITKQLVNNKYSFTHSFIHKKCDNDQIPFWALVIGQQSFNSSIGEMDHKREKWLM